MSTTRYGGLGPPSGPPPATPTPVPATPPPVPAATAAAANSAVAPVNDSRASSSPVSTSGATPSTAVTPRTKSALLAASRVALVATMRTAVADRSRDDARVTSQRAQRAVQRRGRQPAGGIDALAEPDDLHPPVHVGEPARHRVHVGDQQPQRVGPAVDGRDPDPGRRNPAGPQLIGRGHRAHPVATHGP